MPLHILLPLVVLGIAGITALTWALGLAAPRRFATDDDARRAFAREFPEIAVHGVARCRDGSAALLDTAQGPALVWPMGADSTARLLGGVRLRRDARGLVLRLPDYTAPRVALRLPPDEAAQWEARLRTQP